MAANRRRRWPLILVIGGIGLSIALCCGGVFTVFITGVTTAAQQSQLVDGCGLDTSGSNGSGVLASRSSSPGSPTGANPRDSAGTTSGPVASSSPTNTPRAQPTGAMVDTAGLRIGPLRGEQISNAATIIAVGKTRSIPPRGWAIALGTALQESLLRNVRGGDRDSLGLFQQRVSMGWGTPEQIMDPRYSAGKFYDRLLKVPGWQQMRMTQAAQAVQRSGLPEAYQKWEPLANRLVSELAGVEALAGLGPDLCAGTAETVSLNGWTVPVVAHLGSGFRPPDRPRHNGVDLIIARGSPIHAAAPGIVSTVVCNASTGNCDVDGSPAVLGCGWYVEIQHGGGVMTRYCHMGRRPLVDVGQRVQAGQVLGQVGSSGNSSGPHLHFEVHVNGAATDPVQFMVKVGAPLGRAGNG
jgi:hypothetical protein